MGIRKAGKAVDAAADVWRAVGLVTLEIARGVATTLDDWRREGKIKGGIKIGLAKGGKALPWDLVIEGEIDLPKQE